MFQEWGFLLGEIWILLVLAALIGLIAGWIIWGRSSSMSLEGDRLRSELDACRRKHVDKDSRIADLEAALADCKAKHATPAPMVVPVATPVTVVEVGVDYDGDGIIEGENEGTKPATLTAARDGKADDLKQIKGVGPKMEKLCNKLGFYHFDQIASWSDQEVAWVDANLEGFKGRVSRDTWVAQAKILAAGGVTKFSKKVDKGGVYNK
ncbi:MAG: hypothetical protein ACPG5U_01820 [Planktomarina sp.]